MSTSRVVLSIERILKSDFSGSFVKGVFSLQPELFRPLYEDVFGFRKAKVQIHEWIDRRQVSNPDGTDENWVVHVMRGDTAEPKPYWIGTLLLADKPIHTMGRDFSGVAP